jgi:hypothetical protein
MDRPGGDAKKGRFMADALREDEEPILTHPGTPEVARHVHDYEKFAFMMKWGALTCLLIGFIVLLILK